MNGLQNHLSDAIEKRGRLMGVAEERKKAEAAMAEERVKYASAFIRSGVPSQNVKSIMGLTEDDFAVAVKMASSSPPEGD